MSDKRLTVRIADGAIVVRLPLETLDAAVSAAPWNTTDSGDPAFVVANAAKFAREVVHALNREEEDGTTLVHEMFDKAFEHVVEQGGEGIDRR